MSYSQNDINYHRFVDSADVHIDISSKKAKVFLDSIPEPLEENIKGRLADYYTIKSLIHEERNEAVDKYQSDILALKFAKEEKNYNVAGVSCLGLFSRVYLTKNDTTAYKYLEQAKEYFTLDNDSLGLIEVEQVYAYSKFIDYKSEECNALLLSNLDTYKNIKEDAYFYMFATFMLTVNYIDLDSLDRANVYLKEFKSLENDTTIVKYNYLAFQVGIDVPIAEYYFKKKQLDSTIHYLSKAEKLRNYMDSYLIKNYLNLSIETYKALGDLNKTKAYIDSLLVFEEKMISNVVTADDKFNAPLLKAELELNEAEEKKFLHGILIVVLFIILISIGYLYNRKKKLNLIENLSSQEGDLSYLKSNNEKLAVKVQGLEEYIVNLKKDVKSIASINDPLSLRESIKDFYKNLHLNSSTLLDKTESHLELVNDLNVEFFKKINELHPQLNNSEVIICYYLSIGFKNKEIAVFLNSTVRAIESKRYRITKKINLEKNTLLQHLETTF